MNVVDSTPTQELARLLARAFLRHLLGKRGVAEAASNLRPLESRGKRQIGLDVSAQQSDELVRGHRR